MKQWYWADASDISLDLSLLMPIPLGLDPRWLCSHINGVDSHIRYFLLGDRQRPYGYAPFVVRQGTISYCLGEISIFRIPVVRYTMQGSPLCENHELLAELFEPLHKVVGKRGVVFCESVSAGSPLADLLTLPTSPVFKYFHVVPYGPLYARRLIELPAGSQFEDYLNTLSTKTQYDIRRTRKNFTVKAKGPVKVICYTKSEQADELAAALSYVSRKTYQYHLLGLGFENTPEYIAQLRSDASGGWLRTYVLWIGENPVAFRHGYHDGKTYYAHGIGYDPEISKLQPGIYLHTEAVSDLLANGICRFDFLSGDSLYKRRMSNAFREERRYYLIPRGWPSTVYAYAMVAVNSLSDTIGRWLEQNGLKDRIRKIIRTSAVRRSTENN